MRTALLMLLGAVAHAQTLVVTGPAAMEYRLFSAALQTALDGWRIVQAKQTEVAGLAAANKPRAVIVAATCTDPQQDSLAKELAPLTAVVLLVPPGCSTRFDYRVIRIDLEEPWNVNPVAHFRIAAKLLEMFGAQPVRATVHVEAGNATARATHGSVRDVKTDDIISWTQEPSVLLWPLGLARAATRKPGLRLKVNGLAGRRYRLAIDGQTIGEFEASAFAAGVDLAMHETPMSKRAERLLGRNVEALRQWCTGVRSPNPGLDIHDDGEAHGYELYPLD